MPTEPESPAEEAPPAARPATPLDAEGRERPAFLLGFPEDPALAELTRAFEAGNYAYVRREAPGVVARAEDPAVRAAAQELQRRLEPDPVARYVLYVSVALLLLLTWWAYARHAH